jgi:hypothetical protein
MKRFLAFAMICIAAAFCFSCSNTEKCLEKHGYKNCESLKNALNLQNKDEAIKYHDICIECGCKD